MSQTQQAPATPTKFAESTVDLVLSKVTGFQTNGDLKLPPNYSAENAVRSAWLMLQEIQDMNKQPVLTVCSKESIANALLDMVLQGLSPVKKQCYFIAYGGKLQMQRSYMGTIAIAKRVSNVVDATANIIYQGDKFKYQIDPASGKKKIVEHDQEFENIDIAKIKGAYAIVIMSDGSTHTELMTMQQIRTSWAMGKAKGDSPAHRQFPDQMAMKTVINRALKVLIGSSNDSSLYEEDELPIIDQVTDKVRLEIKDNANNGSIGFDEEPVMNGNDITEKPMVAERRVKELFPMSEEINIPSSTEAGF